MLLASPTSLSNLEDRQPIAYPNIKALAEIKNFLYQQPNICKESDILALKTALKEAHDQKAFFIHAGDCSEKFSEMTEKKLSEKILFLKAICQQLESLSHIKTLAIGRIGGQFAKPRTLLKETLDGETLDSYRGDLINQHAFSKLSREANPHRLITGYQKALLTHQLIDHLNQQGPVCFSSHEALNLAYDRALTHQNSKGEYYNFSTHMPWLGMRTAFIDSPHLEYLSQIANPVAVKLGPDMEIERLAMLINKLNPLNEAGKLVLIPRLGMQYIEIKLPKLIDFCQKEGFDVLWFCDPMHGNTLTLENGYKTRNLETILEEISLCSTLLKAQGARLNGLHLEATPDKVNECIDSNLASEIDKLTHNYHSALDPRLNQTQTKSVVGHLAKCL